MKYIEVTVEDSIAIVSLQRENAANALSQAMIKEITAQLDEWKLNAAIRAIIVTGAGEKGFCAGADLKERRGMSELEVRGAVGAIRDMINKLAEMPMPVIAAINGAAIGGGLELALACDLRIGADHATFALTETSLGIIPGAGGTQRLPRVIGVQRAKEMIYTGKNIDAVSAYEWGLLMKVVPPMKLIEEGKQLARQIVRNGPIAIRQAKYALNHGLEVDIQTGLKLEEKAYEVTIPTKDRLEGLLAFKEKRKPNFTGE
ncbi:enoyl-CoA hydratase [Evansella sp. AB-rgal1]|uniref:enoyl-CoA hydratase n=1 Tax=Evansella sp. AB-rgal1 TaxID=3242696 RepID=UPI00359D0C1D